MVNKDLVTNLSNRTRTTTLDNGFLDGNVAAELNTYRTWNSFDCEIAPQLKYEKDGNSVTRKYFKIKGKAVKSLFNNVHAIPLSDVIAKTYNRPLLDSPGTRIEQRKQTACTIKDLVEASGSGIMGRQIYNYSDFAYCKYLGKVPNNYLITLRRFPTPCGDHIDLDLDNNIPTQDDTNIQGHNPDVGRLVTWMGTPGNEMSNILKYSYHLNWKPLEATLTDEQQETAGGPLGSLFNATDEEYGKQVQAGLESVGNTPYKSVASKFKATIGDAVPYNSSEWRKNYDNNRVYGPLDVIAKTTRRDRGLEFDQKFNLTFDYQLKSYDGINGKAAFLDLLANILCVTYTTGKFWRGGYHFYGAHVSNVFTNLPIFKAAENGQLNSFAGITDAIVKSWNSVNEDVQKKGGWTELAKKVSSNIIGMLAGEALNKLGRPQKMALQSLLSPAPVGCWHLTIGNPKAPIMEIGDLCLKNASIEHYGPLGLDDFPTGIKVTVELEPGKPRDASGIEQMYQRGDSRVYLPLGSNVVDMYKSATVVKGSSDQAANPAKSDVQGIENCGVSDDVLIKYFGLNDANKIKISAQEVTFGSVSSTSKSS